MDVPWMGTLTLPNANQTYNLLTLLQAKDPTLTTARILRAQFLMIQVDDSLASGTLYIGNANVSATEYGVFLASLQSLSFPSMESNLIVLASLNLFSDTTNTTIHVTFLTR